MIDEQVRERVLNAADRLYYGRGIQSVGMDELRRASGVSLKGLYGVFPSKAAIVLEVLDRRLRGEDPVETLQRDAGRSSQLIHTHRLDAPAVIQTVRRVEHALSHPFIHHSLTLLALRTFVLYG